LGGEKFSFCTRDPKSSGIDPQVLLTERLMAKKGDFSLQFPEIFLSSIFLSARFRLFALTEICARCKNFDRLQCRSSGFARIKTTECEQLTEEGMAE